MREFLATTAAIAFVAATPAQAQSLPADAQGSNTQSAAPEGAAAQPGAGGREGEIIVTARKREERIRDIPGTISAVTADQLAAKGPLVTTGDLLSTVPGVRFNNVGAENLSEVSIRGSGSERATGADSGIGLFVNGAYVGASILGGRNFRMLDYFDVDHVEVLEGPQGALYGRNSEFGVVNIILAKPQFDNSGYLRDLFTAQINQNRLEGIVNQQVSDKVAVRLGAEVYGQTKGFYYDPNNNRYYDRTNGWTARGQVRYKSGPLDATLLVDAQDMRLPSFVNSYVLPAGINAALPLGLTQSRFNLPHTGLDGMQQKVQRMMFTANYDLGGAQLDWTTMLSGWRSSQQYAPLVDLNGEIALRQQGELGLYPYGQVTTNAYDRTFYQDVHLSGSAAGGKLSWIVGAEGLNQHDDYRITIASSPCPFTAISQSICAGTPTAPLCIQPLPTSTNCPTPFPSIFGTDSRTRQRVNSYAAYASLQYRIGDLTLAGEGRISRDDKVATQYIYALYTTNYTRVPSTYSFKATQPVYTVTVSYKIPNALHTLLYAKVGSGYRAGGVNSGTYNPLAPNPFVFTYGNENTISYEAGAKTNITPNIFFRLSAYLSHTHDAITSINDGCTPTNICGTGQQFFNVNGGTIHARGVEAAASGRFPVAGGQLAVDLNAATQHAYFYDVPTGVAGLPVPGSKVAQIPDWTFSATAGYRRQLATHATGFINFDYSGQRGGGQDTVTIATPYIPMDNFDLFGGQIGVDFNKLEVALFVRNLTNETIRVLKFNQVVGGVGYLSNVRYNRPRTFGASVSYRW